MTSIEDFTRLALGADVALEGRVSRCSRCGRNGIEQGRGEGPSYYVIHVQTSRVFGDGMLTEPRDYCVLPESAAPPPADSTMRRSEPATPVPPDRATARA